MSATETQLDREHVSAVLEKLTDDALRIGRKLTLSAHNALVEAQQAVSRAEGIIREACAEADELTLQIGELEAWVAGKE